MLDGVEVIVGCALVAVFLGGMFVASLIFAIIYAIGVL